MSKSTTMGKAEEEPKKQESLVRLTTNEFRELLPHLELHEVLVTEILRNEKWMHLINVFSKPRKEKSVQCHICETKVGYTNVMQHLKGQRHMDGLKKIKQFFNPIYTYCKEAHDLMNGSKKPSEKELKQAIEAANIDLANRTNVAAHFAKIIQNSSNKKKPVDDPELKMLKKLVLETKPFNPSNIFAQVNLPLLTMLTVEFRAKEGADWEPIITTSNPHPNSRFECKLCKLMCGGVITVNAHFAGYNHKKLQLETLGIRCKMYPYLTKNCVYQYDSNFNFSISEQAKSFFKFELDQLKAQGVTADDDDVIEVLDDEEAPKEKLPSINEAPAAIKERALALYKQSQKLPLREDEKLSAMLRDEENQRRAILMPETSTADLAVNTNDFCNSTGLVGVEYVICVNRTDYECVLCEFYGLESRMAEHLTSYAHRLKYLELHYPDTMEGYKNRMGSMPYKSFLRVMGLVLERVAAALESHHGYGAVRHVSKTEYNAVRPRIVSELYSLPHASQKWGPSFSTAVGADLLDRFKRDKDMHPKPFTKHKKQERFTKLSPKDYNECNAAERKGRPLELPKSPPPRRPLRRSHSRSRSRSPRSRRHHDHATPPVVHRSGDPMSRESAIWKAYRREVSKAASDIERHYMEYRLQPETHPMYNQEWNRFWKSRKEELIALNIDHRSYNFQPEWVNYFEKRIEYFFGEALHQSQLEIRRKMNIPLDAEEDTPTEPKRRHISSGGRDGDVRGGGGGSGVQYEPRDKRMRMEDSNAHWQGPVAAGPPPSGGDNLMYGGNVGNNRVVEPPPPAIVDTKPNVIHVLRLLTAFEDHLGSLGGKVMDLLSKALTLEKRYGDDFIGLESKLLNASNCSLIETSAEKLKGILFAGLLDENKEQSFTRVVNATDKLLRHAEQMGYRNLEEEVALVSDVVRGADSESSRGRSTGGGLESASTSDIQKLLSVLQSRKTGGGNNAPTQKSLSDTLMELISGGGGGGGSNSGGGISVDVDNSSNRNPAKSHARNDYDEPSVPGVGHIRDREISSDRGSGFDNPYSNPYAKNNNQNRERHSNSNERNNPNARVMNRMNRYNQQQQQQQKPQQMDQGGSEYQQTYDDQPMNPTNNKSSTIAPLMTGLMNFDTKLTHGFNSGGGGGGSGSGPSNTNLGYNNKGMGGPNNYKNNYNSSNQQQGYNKNNQSMSNKQMMGGNMGQNVGGVGVGGGNTGNMQNRGNNAGGAGYRNRNQNQNFNNYSNDNSTDFDLNDSMSNSMNPTAPNNGGGGGGNYGGAGGNFGNNENWGRFQNGNQQQQQQNQRGSWQQQQRQQQQQQPQYGNAGRRGGFN